MQNPEHDAGEQIEAVAHEYDRRVKVFYHIIKQAQRVSNAKITSPSQVAIANLANYYLYKLPDLAPFTSLRYVCASGCGLVEILPYAFLALEELDVSYNAIKRVPNITAPTLKIIDLSHNYLTQISDFSQFPALYVLNLSFNALCEPYQLKCGNLRTLRVTYCYLVDFTIANDLQRLDVFECRQNAVYTVENIETLPQSIREIIINDNPVALQHRCFEACCYRFYSLRKYNGKECTPMQVRFGATKFAYSSAKK